MCDAGGFYQGKLSADEVLAQIDYLVGKRYPDRIIPSEKFKIQFARMGEPALNDAVLSVLQALPERYQAPGIMPSISTVAPHGRDQFFDQLKRIKDEHYPRGSFQFQISIHTSDPALRDEIIPVRKWDFAQIAAFGERYLESGDRKITLNAALAAGMPLDATELRRFFDPEIFLFKITPLNPTHRASKHQLRSHIDPYAEVDRDSVIEALRGEGYQVIVSIGEVEENLIGSNCGQFVLAHLRQRSGLDLGYSYHVHPGDLEDPVSGPPQV
jgi:23S rRNA (adenine2503-C2)-methyltransferase